MLSAEHRAIVSATVPILEQGGEALTRHFYPILFRDYPQVKPYFNQTHQSDGAQPRALANAVLMYAKNIDRLEALGPLVGQIVSKHVALDIRPEHYPMVGASLLQAIREVLGADVATDAVIEAWGAAYGQLAGILAGAEGRAYDALAAAPGGWNGLRRFVVAGKRRESDEITSFVFRPEDGGPVADFQPGQYIGLRAVVDGVDQRRNYSLSAAPDGATYQISVKRERGGAMSNHLHDAVNEGDVVELLPPSGVFTLAAHASRPIVFITGGVGITPTLAMLPAALASGRDVHFIHAARHGGVHAFRAHVDALASRHPQLRRHYLYAEDAGHAAPDAVGLLDSELLAAWLPESRDVDAYFLGPQPFMKVVRKSLRELGVPESQTYHEFFGPAAALA
ncbi:NO-inducible flavohemoprotein [Massilia dura]|uniref:Flavohemoprotein n=1 Tax=Pseudoduganella dura TaxID=321982 RepID=A0A6I3XCF6_9BURK|nr:NO-inducible flavohemoprotein [Pseudoduganella dura]MUI11211.1 NO-inducible flavohemoprotein [Pseudoduganella dura]GGX94018.1 flavohemoprotein [Pseudoduganella dura]